jgi:hypothetical protein
MQRNRLAAETSPYLLQHADNPADWYPTGTACSAPFTALGVIARELEPRIG